MFGKASDTKPTFFAVATESLSQAIGRGGQNVRLATELTGWELNVRDAEEVNKDSEEELHKLVEVFKEQLNVDQDIATVLVEVGFNTVEEIAYVPSSEMLEIDGFDAELVDFPLVLRRWKQQCGIPQKKMWY